MRGVGSHNMMGLVLFPWLAGVLGSPWGDCGDRATARELCARFGSFSRQCLEERQRSLCRDRGPESASPEPSRGSQHACGRFGSLSHQCYEAKHRERRGGDGESWGSDSRSDRSERPRRGGDGESWGSDSRSDRRGGDGESWGSDSRSDRRGGDGGSWGSDSRSDRSEGPRRACAEGEWGAWGVCSRSCGGGVQRRSCGMDGAEQRRACSRLACWEAEELHTLLEATALTEHEPAMLSEEISVEVLSQLSDQQLASLGLATLGARHRLVRAAIQTLVTRQARWEAAQAQIDKELGLDLPRLGAPAGWTPEPPPCPFDSWQALKEEFDQDESVIRIRELVAAKECVEVRRVYRRVALKYHPDKLKATHGWAGCPSKLAQPAMAVLNQQYDDACRH